MGTRWMARANERPLCRGCFTGNRQPECLGGETRNSRRAVVSHNHQQVRGDLVTNSSLLPRIGLMAALCGATVAPAAAYKWPGDTAGLASAISAKVIGQRCAGLLSASD